MSWLFPHWQEAEKRLDGALSEQVLASEALSQATTAAAEQAERNSQEAELIAEHARRRISQQQARRERRKRAEQDRGIVMAIEDVLKLRSFGGPGDGEV
ncbi:hypothetical protein MMB17_18635 [Methylobacterium organophilum]|uniref:hypothetical protein n=1 Tax=Methylobacterium organophilum TaxID=410 RepID=UPI001F12E622|nr:hypothetical protein [Methylobacterium organophilum]UMY16680.1 hypothetical protein MMB17_18635 [Methylobacterium organophilum]